MEQRERTSNRNEKKYWKEIDEKLEEAQSALLMVLHDSDAAILYSSVAIDAAIVVANGGARL